MLHPPDQGAGTPDREALKWDNLLNHYNSDVKPYMDCCLRCEEPNTYCPLYIAKARSGDTIHCIVNQDDNVNTDGPLTSQEPTVSVMPNLTTTDVEHSTIITTEGTTP